MPKLVKRNGLWVPERATQPLILVSTTIFRSSDAEVRRYNEIRADGNDTRPALVQEPAPTSSS